MENRDLFLQILFVSGSVFFLHATAYCDFFDGNWVPPPAGAIHPLYNSSTCPFIGREFDCLKNGRRDSRYIGYIWRPSGCSLRRLEAEELLYRFSGKSIMFVGDSLSRNQWTSLVCILHAALPRTPYTLHTINDLTTFTFTEYSTKVMLHHSVFLVDVVRERGIGRVLKLDSMESGKLWKKCDMLIFNTWHWWTRTGAFQPWDYIQDGAKIMREMNRLAAFEKALGTWAKWVNTNIDPDTTQVFFQGISPSHYHGVEWDESSKKTCKGETVPMTGSIYPGGSPAEQKVVKRAVMSTGIRAKLLDITRLSQLRKDGHPSVYGMEGRMDCSHWCLPGVPDTWNQILYNLAF